MLKPYRFINNIKDNEKGSILISTLMVSLILIVLSSSLANVGLSEAKETRAAIDKTQAYYVTKTGVEIAVHQLMENAKEGKEFQFPYEITGTIDGNEYLVEVSGSLEEITIESTGNVGHHKEFLTHILKGESKGNQELIFDIALFSDNEIKLEGSAKIIGDVITNTIEAESIDLAWSTEINGDLALGVGGIKDKVIKTPRIKPEDNIKGLIYNLDVAREYDSPILPAFPKGLATPPNHEAINNGILKVGPWPYQSYTLTEDAYFNEITISSGGNLTIDVGSEKRVIRTKKLDIQQGFIKLIGSGKLILYVDEYFGLLGSSTLNASGNSENVILYYNGSREVFIGGSTQIVGTLYSGPADITFSNAGKIKGNVISAGENINITGAGLVDAIVLYAPSAYVNVGGAGSFKGTIIGKSFTAVGAGKIEYNGTTSELVPILTSNEGNGEIIFTRGLWK